MPTPNPAPTRNTTRVFAIVLLAALAAIPACDRPSGKAGTTTGTSTSRATTPGPITPPTGTPINSADAASPVVATNRFPLNLTLNKGAASSQMQLTTEGGTNFIQSGDAKFRPSDKLDVASDKALRLENFSSGDGTAIVRVDVGPKSTLSMTIAESKNASGPPILVDNKGQRYEAIGFFYRDDNLYHIRFTPDRTIQSLNDLPSISSNRDDQEIFLLFRCSLNVEITTYAIGTTGIRAISPAIKMVKQTR